MRTEQDLEIAFLNGDLNEEEQEKYLLGEALEGDTKADASPAPEPTAEEKTVADTAAETDGSQGEPPIVLAKDGKNTIPFSVVEDLRGNLKELKDENAQIRQAFEEQKGLLAKLTQAEKEDVATGTTEATDTILKDLEEDYPGITAALMKQIVDPLKMEIEPIKAEREAAVVKSAEETARSEFDAEVSKLEPTYLQTVNNQQFWDWFGKQSPLIRSAQTSPDPAVVADVIKLYNSQHPQAGDTAVADAVMKSVVQAQARSVIQSLSDVPGGQSPASNETDAFGRMSHTEQLDRLMRMNPDDIEKLMNKIV